MSQLWGVTSALPIEQNLVVMLNKDGSRDHSIQEEILFRDSEIKYFLAYRASIYTAIEKNLCEFFLVRASCWFHARHYLEDAYVSDPRVYDIIEDILTRFMNGEDADESFIPNHYTPRLVCEQKIA